MYQWPPWAPSPVLSPSSAIVWDAIVAELAPEGSRLR
jgi:hypothetical protein